MVGGVEDPGLDGCDGGVVDEPPPPFIPARAAAAAPPATAVMINNFLEDFLTILACSIGLEVVSPMYEA